MANWEPEMTCGARSFDGELTCALPLGHGTVHQRHIGGGKVSFWDDNVFPISGEPQRESVQVEAIPSRASLTLSDPGALGSASNESSPESLTEIADGILERMDSTERDLDMAWTRLRRTMRGE